MTAITTSDENGVLTLRLARPEKRNALTRDMLLALTEAVRSAESGRTVRAILIEGDSTAFCAGADIAAYSDASVEALAEFTSAANVMCDTIAASPLPVVAVVEGVAMGGGFELALACDLIVAAPTASFALPELALGLIPGWGGIRRLTALIGANRAREFIWLGGRMNAEDALDLGVVSRLVPAPDLADESRALASRLAKLPARAVESTKRCLAPGGPAERDELLDLFGSPDGIEGVHAFLEKRPAEFAVAR